MRRSRVFIFFMLAFLSGIIVAALWREEVWGELVVMLFLAGLYLFRLRFGVGLFLLLSFFLGAWFFERSFDLEVNDVGFYEGRISFEACIQDEVDVRRDKVKYVLTLKGDYSGRVLVNAERYPVYEFGDCFRVSGFLERPENFEDFNYENYLARYDIYSVMRRPEMELISQEESLMSFLFSFKAIFQEKLEDVFSEPHGSFMAGLILGTRAGIPDDLMQDFNITGLTHIIAISGWNITLVIMIVSGVFGFLSRRWRVVFSGIFVILFVFLVGASAAVVRAAIMGVISLLAVFFGRVYFVEIALLGAAFVMSLWNPKILVYDVGFQLSFLATAGLLYVVPRIERFFKFLPSWLGVRESVLMTISAQVLALPVILMNFGSLSLISPLANVFVLPLVPLAMIFGFLAVVFSFLWSGLGLVFGFVGYLILELIVWIVGFFAAFEFASVEVNWFGGWMLMGYYLFLAGYLQRD